jgi:hypothetical protein
MPLAQHSNPREVLLTSIAIDKPTHARLDLRLITRVKTRNRGLQFPRIPKGSFVPSSSAL